MLPEVRVLQLIVTLQVRSSSQQGGPVKLIFVDFHQRNTPFLNVQQNRQDSVSSTEHWVRARCKSKPIMSWEKWFVFCKSTIQIDIATNRSLCLISNGKFKPGSWISDRVQSGWNFSLKRIRKREARKIACLFRRRIYWDRCIPHSRKWKTTYRFPELRFRTRKTLRSVVPACPPKRLKWSIPLTP